MKHITIANELQRLEEQDGTLSPERVVAFARDPKTALHDQFEWDDSAAAHEFRLQQARAVIRVCVRMIGEEHPRAMRAYVSLESDRMKGGGYRTLVSVMEDAAMKAQLLDQAKREAKAWSVRYRELEELAKVHEAVALATA